jgi:hypothetical protein
VWVIPRLEFGPRNRLTTASATAIKADALAVRGEFLKGADKAKPPGDNQEVVPTDRAAQPDPGQRVGTTAQHLAQPGSVQPVELLIPLG